MAKNTNLCFNMIYPLKFSPQLKYRLWGGTRLRDGFAKVYPAGIDKCGESWELSGVEGNLSVVANGFLAGNTIQDLVEVYMGDLVGEKNYQQFGVEFPLLIKLIDTTDFLSIQVHPDDEMAKRLHHAFGKTEMWYIIDSEEDSKIITGFNPKLNREQFENLVKEGGFEEHFNYEQVKPDDYFYIPARSMHSLGKGITLLEIQQTSDVTYRVYDWGRVEPDGKPRELHTEWAKEAIDFDADPIPREHSPLGLNQPQELESTPYFSVNRLAIDKEMERDFFELDTFRIYFCVDGHANVCTADNDDVAIKAGELVLVPASIQSAVLKPQRNSKLLEVYIK